MAISYRKLDFHRKQKKSCPTICIRSTKPHYPLLSSFTCLRAIQEMKKKSLFFIFFVYFHFKGSYLNFLTQIFVGNFLIWCISIIPPPSRFISSYFFSELSQNFCRWYLRPLFSYGFGLLPDLMEERLIFIKKFFAKIIYFLLKVVFRVYSLNIGFLSDVNGFMSIYVEGIVF